MGGGFGAKPATIHSGAGTASSAASSASRGNVRGVQHAPDGTAGSEENILKGDLARALGVYGRMQKVGKYDIPLIYLIVGAGLALLWISGQMNIIRMLVFGVGLYNMYISYQKA